MLRVFKFAHQHGGKFYRISPVTGDLIELYKGNINVSNVLPQKIERALAVCNNPYLCKYQIGNNPDKYIVSYQLELYHKRLLKIGNTRFLSTVLYSSFRRPMFENTVEAFNYISKLPEQIRDRGKLCLQRSFLALKTSKSFISNGVLFIGALLPTGSMHAWIIEKDYQPDILDREWIMYVPLLAYYYG